MTCQIGISPFTLKTNDPGQKAGRTPPPGDATPPLDAAFLTAIGAVGFGAAVTALRELLAVAKKERHWEVAFFSFCSQVQQSNSSKHKCKQCQSKYELITFLDVEGFTEESEDVCVCVLTYI